MLFILNSDLQIIDTLSVKGIISQGNTPYFEDYYTQILATGAETFEFKTMADSRESRNIIVGNYIAFRDDNGDDKLFNIIETNESRSEQGFIKSVYCEMHGIELKNNIIRPMKMLNTSLEKFAETILSDTDWQVGEIDDFGGLLDINIEEHISVYDAIQKYAIGEFGAEIYYTVEIKSNSVVNKYLNIVENRGLDEGIKFTYNKNIQNIERTIDTSNLCTALIGVGNNGLTFKNIEASDKPLNQDFIVNETAYQQWSKNGYHIFGYETFETDSDQELLKLTRNKLYERGTPRVKYELNVELLDVDVRIGDYVRITDMEFEPPIMLEARISTLTKSKTDINGNQCEISNFKHLQSNITEQMRKLSSNLKGYADNINIDNISKGGFLSSKITVVDESTLGIGNQVETGKDFCVDFKNLTAETVLTDFVLPNKKVMQQAIVDYHENKIYISCDETSNGNVVLYQTDMSGKILGQMTLNQFGHSNSFGIERRNNRTYIWLECDAKQAYSSEPQKLRGTKLCYFEFKNGVTANKTYGTVIDILPGWVNLSLGIDDTYNQIAVRALDKIGGTYYYHVFNLDEVINGTFKAKYKFKDVGLQGTSSYQGFDILGNYIYAIQGAGYYTHPPKMDSYVTCIDIQSGKKRYVNLIDILPNAPFREIEGIKVIKKSARVYELNFGMVTEHQSPRKNHVFKYTYTVPLESNPQGKFVHPNGWTTSISEGLIKVDNSKKKNYLMYVVDGERFKFEEGFSKQIIMANYENGIWYCNGEEFKPMANDCIIGKATPNQDNHFDLTIYSESSQSLGSTLSGSSDSLMYEDGKIIVNAGGLVGQLPTDLIEVESINANHISANAITADKIQSNSIESKHIKAEVFEAINADIENLVAGKADIENLNAINAKIENLQAGKAEIEDLKATNAQIENLKVNKADIEQLNATNANIQNLVAKDAEIENLVSNKATIEDLKASNAEIDNLKASNAEIKNLVSNKADIEQLNATNATINTLNANKANIADLQAANAQINNLKADKADITELNAVKGNITILQSEVAEIGSIKSDVADIEHILAGNITADNIASGTITSDKIQTGTITSGSGIIADGAIGNAHVSSLEASKISSGTIDTSKVTVQGTNGHLRIKGNRLQVFNGTGSQAKERVSVGDVNGDGTVYGLRVRGVDGTTVLLDENGVTSEGITDGSITNEKVSDDANIDGAKLNINSVVNKINEDGTEVIKGTKIEVNGTSLVTQLSTMTSKQTEQGEKISQNTSSIKANENAIKLKLDSQTYQTDKTNMTSTLNKHTSEISALQDEISLKVEQTDIETANNALKSEIQEDLNDINERINDILTDVGGAIADGIIEESETIMINSSITQLNKEKETLTQRYNYIYNLSTLASIMKSSLKTTMDTYNAKQSALVSHIQSMITDKTISDSERTTYETRLAEYSTALANINKKIEECMDSISTSKIDTAKAEIKVTTDSISQSVTNLSNTVSTKADGSTVSTLSSKVGSLETSVDGITGQVSSLEKSTTSLGSQVSDLEGEINTVKSDVASLEVTTSGISQKVSSVESTTSTLSTKVNTIEDTANTANSNATNALNKSNSAIEKADDAKDTADTANSKVDNLQVGGTNLWVLSDLQAGYENNGGIASSTACHQTRKTIIDISDCKTIAYQVWNPNKVVNSSNTNRIAFFDSSKTYISSIQLPTLNGTTYQTTTITKPTNAVYARLGAITGASSQDTDIKIKFEKGNKPTDYTPAPEDVQGGIDTAQSTANNANSLANTANNTANTNKNNITTLQTTVTTTNNKVAELTTNLDGITQRVASTESTLTTTTNKIDNLQIGGRNFVTNSNKFYAGGGADGITATVGSDGVLAITASSGNGNWYTGWSACNNTLIENNFNEGDTVTISFTMKSPDSTKIPTIYFKQGRGYFSMVGNLSTQYSTVYCTTTWKKTNGLHFHLGFQNAIGTYYIKDWKIEKGSKPTSWTPAPEDVDASIASVDSKVQTTNNKVASIETNLNGITQRVSSTESTVSSHTTQLGTVDTRINNAKNSAISTASSDATTKANNALASAKTDATTKANNALADAKTYTNGQITTVNTTINNKVAEIKATTDAITQRVASTESTTANMNTTLNKVSGGLNKWLFEVFDRGSVTGTGAITLNHLLGKVPRQTLLVSEPLRSSDLLGVDNFLGRLTTNVYLDADYTWNATAYSDDGSSLYLNGNLIVSMASCASTSITMPFKKGWNKITWVFNENTGADVAYFTPAISSLSQIKIIDAFSHTNIDEDKVILNSNITNTNNRVAEITTNLDSITQRVSSTESTVSTHTTQLGTVDSRINNAKNDAISSAVGVKDTRNDNQDPRWYMANYPQRTVEEFKFANKIGVGSSSVYGVLTTVVPWGDSSGGYPTQTFRSNNTATYTRKGTSNTAWGAWTQVEDTAGSQAKANQALTDAKAYTTTEVTKTNNKVATIETNLSGITSRVSATETTTSSLTTQMSNKEDVNSRVIYAKGNGNDAPSNSIVKVGSSTLVSGHGRGLNIVALNPTTLAQYYKGTFDTYGGDNYRTQFAEKIQELNNGNYIIVVTSHDSACLNYATVCNALYLIGGSAPSTSISSYREAYALIGKSKLGKGNGLEMYIPKTADDARVAEVSVKVSEQGALLGVNSNNSESKIDTLTTRISTAESKLTKDSLTTTIGSHYTTSTDVNNAITSKGYATTSQVQQTTDALSAKFSSSGGYNLLRNTSFTNGATHWNHNATCTVDSSKKYGNNNSLKMVSSGATSAVWRGTNQRFVDNAPIGKTYRATLYYYIEDKSTFNSNFVLELKGRKTGATSESNFVSATISASNLVQGAWTKVTVTATTSAAWDYIYIYPWIHMSGTIWISDVIVTEGELEVPWSPHPSEIYDGVTTIDKNGIKVSQSNYNGYTQMKADGFYVNNGSENVISVTSSGATFKGKVTIQSGSTVPTSTLSGTIASSQLNSTITKDISDAKSIADSVNTTVNNSKTNWNNAYNRVNEWAYGAVTGSTTIDGGYIQADTITAKHMAIGDFNNYSQLVKGKSLTNRYGTANWTEGTSNHSYWSTTNQYFPFTVNETLNPFKAGDQVQIKFDAYTPSTRNVQVGIWFYSGTDANNFVGEVTGNVSCSTSWGTKTVNLTLPSGNTYVQSAKSIAILINNGTSGERIEVRNATIRRLVAGDLIVDGAITANKIATGAISASMIITGTLDASKATITNINASNITSGTISASRISADTLKGKTITGGTISGGTISGATISGGTFSSYGTNSESGQAQSMTLDSGSLNLVGTQAGGTNAGQNLNKAMVVSNGFVTKDISNSGNGGNCDAFYSNTGIGWREKSAGGEQTGSFPSIMTFGSDRISTTKNMYAEKFYGAGLFCTYTNLYLGCSGEVRATDMNGRNDGNTVYKPIRASKFMRADGKHAYINNTGGGTLTSADSALVANGIRTDATDFFLGVGGQVRVTDKNGHNNGNGLTYKPITASAHNNSSDLIFKKNIKKLDDSKNIKMFSESEESFAIKTLKDVTVYEYDLVDGEENQIGLIAQECPQVLRGSDAMYDLDIETANSITDEERKELINEDVVGASINLYSMATMLWKVCQEQQTMIEKLEKRISELENKVTE